MARYWIHSAPGDYTDDGLRECARAERCSDPRIESANGKNVRVPALTYRAFCDQCRNAIHQALLDLPAYQTRVHAEIGNRGQACGPRVSASKSPPIPINLKVDELLTDMAAVLLSWHERVAVVARLADPDRSVRTASTVLAAHVDVLLALPEEPMMRSVWLHEAAKLPPGTLGLVHKSAEYADTIQQLDGARAGLEVLQLHYRCRSLLGVTKAPARHLPGVYCDCGYPELYEVLDGDGQPSGARCRQCRNEYDSDQYADLTKVRSEMAKTHGRRRLQTAGTDDSTSRRA